MSNLIVLPHTISTLPMIPAETGHRYTVEFAMNAFLGGWLKTARRQVGDMACVRPLMKWGTKMPRSRWFHGIASAPPELKRSCSAGAGLCPTPRSGSTSTRCAASSDLVHVSQSGSPRPVLSLCSIRPQKLRVELALVSTLRKRIAVGCCKAAARMSAKCWEARQGTSYPLWIRGSATLGSNSLEIQT